MLLKTSVVIFLACVTAIGQDTIAEQQIICDGNKVTIDAKTTIAADSKYNIRMSPILNGYATTFVKPAYPEGARAKRLSGSSSVVVLIDDRGKVISAKAVSGHKIFRPLAVKAALSSRFKKLIRDCKPAKYSGVVTYFFHPD